MFRSLILSILLIYFQNEVVSGAKILAISNNASPSHSLWCRVLINGLANRGHIITFLTAHVPSNSKELHKNVKYIDLNEIDEKMYTEVNIAELINLSPLDYMEKFCNFSVKNCEATLEAKRFQKFILEHRNDKYDLVIHNSAYGPCLLGLLHIYDYPPLVSVSPFPYQPSTNRLVGGHYYPSYVPFHSGSLEPQYSFYDRMYNHILYLAEEYYREYIFTPEVDKLVRAVFPSDMPYLGDLEKRTTIALVGTHSALTQPQPLPQNVIEIGGLNIVDPEPLPEHLNEFIESSKNGAVLFSLGTNLQPKYFNASMIDMFIEVIEKFPDYNFMWKFDPEFVKRDLPKNLMIQKVFPQRDILANPKVQLFITHAGGLSTQESIWYGVPMVTVPLFMDQVRNSRIATNQGIAIALKFLELNENNFYQAVGEVLHNSSYAENIAERSNLFRDRPMKPLDTAIWWIEYVLRHPNPDFLRVPTFELGFFISNSYDFVVFVVLCIWVAYYVLSGVLKSLCGYKRSRRNNYNKSTKRKRN